MTVDYCVVSIGTMAQNLLWDEAAAVRTAHATCTLVLEEDRRILVDPSLPKHVLLAKLFERTGKGADWITDVFCTTLRPDSRRGIEAFPEANWYAGEVELEWYARQLEAANASNERLTGEQAEDLQQELQLVGKLQPVPEKLGPQTTPYPLHGATPGCTGLLLTPPTQTLLIAGPAAPTREHVQRGMVWEQSADREQALQTLEDLLELVDLIVPGYDNIVFHPRRFL